MVEIDERMFQYGITRPQEPREPEELSDAQDNPEQSPKFSILCLLSYPLNGPGLSIVSIYVLVPFFVWVLVTILPYQLRIAGGFILFLIKILVSLSTFWYLTVCVRASAEGQMQAPNVFEFGQDDSFWDWLREFFIIALTVSLCIAPAFLLKRFAGINTAVFLTVLGTGIFFMPMLLLAVVMFDTISALNPILIIASVFSTFFKYAAVVVLFFVPIALTIWMNMASRVTYNPLLILPARAISIYLLMMDACLLGRFFYRNEEKLRWDV